MLKDNKIWMAKAGDKDLYLLPKMANRHGLIAGATGTGKTITLKVMAESFSDMGVPVFFSDVKGDLSGMCVPGVDSENMQTRIANFGIEGWEYKSYPVCFWDLFGEKGHPVRMTISDIGPMLLARLLNLTDVQEGVLNIVFKVADEQGLLLLDLKDLRAMLQYVSDNKEEYQVMYGNVSSASVGAIQRALLAFEQEGGTDIFGEPALDVRDWVRTDMNGRGVINILSSEKLFGSPNTYGMFLLWMLSELYEIMPEVGDLEKPRLVFFFDEAHVLFDNTPKALHQKIAQIIKLIRSKGIGVYFVTQNPGDIPGDVLGQLSNRIQHGLRAYTPAEQKGIKAAAESFRVNENFKTEEALQALGTGEALVSFLDEKGIPAIVESAKILPPQSLMGMANDEDVQRIITAGEFDLKYRQTVDRVSAYEIIMQATEKLNGAASDYVNIGASQVEGQMEGQANDQLNGQVSEQASGQLNGQASGQLNGQAGAEVLQPKFDPYTGERLVTEEAAAEPVARFDPYTGEPLQTTSGTGAAAAGAAGVAAGAAVAASATGTSAEEISKGSGRVNLTEQAIAKSRAKQEEPLFDSKTGQPLNDAAKALAAGNAGTEVAETKTTKGLTKTSTSTKSTRATQSSTQKVAQRAVTNATSSVARSMSTNLVNSITGSGKVSSASDIGKRAATNALSSVMRSGATSLVRGLFGNLSK